MSAGRKIVHIDMDCFYAAIEIRDRPELRGKPVAVGGRQRGVLTTCSYEARKFGCRSAMPTYQAMRLCPDLIVLPVRFDLYRAESQRIRCVFSEFSDLVEPLSLDEAYLDVSHLESEGASIASEIRARIRAVTGLTASAGIAPNKFLAKVASDWRKPDGQYEVTQAGVAEFVGNLPIERIWGVGKRTAEKIHSLGARTCGELQRISLIELDRAFGKFGSELHELCRGIDHRRVNPARERKSVSNEHTYLEDLASPEAGLQKLTDLVAELHDEVAIKHADRSIREAVVKLKFSDFSTTTAQRATDHIDPAVFDGLLREAWNRGGGKSVRLIGTGVRFAPLAGLGREAGQLEMF
jgi:DNA polymerase IV